MDKELLDILACPVCKSDVKYNEKESILVCVNKNCGKVYKVEDGIPIMLV